MANDVKTDPETERTDEAMPQSAVDKHLKKEKPIRVPSRQFTDFAII
jgi:hypothetical protein